MSPLLELSLTKFIKDRFNSQAKVELLKNLQHSHLRTYDKNFIMVYGSLRKDGYNFQRLRSIYGFEEVVYIADCSITGYSLVDLGQFPAAVYTAGKERLEGEIIYVSDKAYKAIYNMEKSAGYELYEDRIDVRIEPNRIGVMDMGIFVANSDLEKTCEDMPIVECGNWVDYLRETYAE